jgi:hypothetical protein
VDRATVVRAPRSDADLADGDDEALRRERERPRSVSCLHCLPKGRRGRAIEHELPLRACRRLVCRVILVGESERYSLLPLDEYVAVDVDPVV